ncbi:hypothetical protein WMY93_007308 [Mugilogobius chulae]|uniref:NADH dehydrogenase [ubiquinone] 1 alpha subcomplex subunit 2 n=1 Tax=Mugilogobius chulae TaxID=88201 RepID=A0AAW0PG07_9GOBI
MAASVVRTLGSSLARNLREVRLHLSQSSAGSLGRGRFMCREERVMSGEREVCVSGEREGVWGRGGSVCPGKRESEAGRERGLCPGKERESGGEVGLCVREERVMSGEREVCVSGEREGVLGAREFVENHYVNLKKSNPDFPILIRECSGVRATLWARYAHGQERSVSLENMSCDEVASALNGLAQHK